MKPNYRIRATTAKGQYRVYEGRSLVNLKRKATQLENEGANGYIERTDNHAVVHHFGRTSTLHTDGTVTQDQPEKSHAETVA